MLSIEFCEVNKFVEIINLNIEAQLLVIEYCPSFNEAYNLVISEKFKESFSLNSKIIGILINFNEEFKLLTQNQLDEMEAKYFDVNRSILISFHSNVDQKFFIRWKFENKMVILEVINDHDEDLRVVGDFTRNFLLKSLKNGDSGEFKKLKFLFKIIF